MTDTIKVSIRSVYGNETVYPACPMSIGFARIAGTKTLTADTLRLIQGMGFKITVEVPVVSFA
jgi:hypothetical protein